MQFMKKAQWQLLAILNPYVLLGIAIFAALLLIGLYFALAQVIGVILIISGVMLFFRPMMSPWWAISLIVIGILMARNPFDWVWANLTYLQMIGGA